MRLNQTTDPADELFDVLDEDGNFTGEVKRRADVHRDGDWHRAFHLWIVAETPDGVSRVLFQRRSACKDTWPDHLDVAVGGHFRAGETITDVIREIDEEIGIQPDLSELIFAGRRRAASIQSEWRDREIEEVYFLAFHGGFPEFRPNANEIAGLTHLAIPDLLGLFNGESRATPAIAAPVVADRRLGDWQMKPVSSADFVPVEDHYWVRGARAGQALLDGAAAISIELHEPECPRRVSPRDCV